MMRTLLAGSCGALALAAATLAQGPVLPFPMDVASLDTAKQEVELVPRIDEIQALATSGPVVLSGLVLPDGSRVDLDLTRLFVERYGFRFRVDGERRPDLLEGLDLSIWTGTVFGEPESEVMLSFSTYGSRGWLRRGGMLVHFIPLPDEGGNWAAGSVLATTEESLNRQGRRLQSFCGLDELPDGPRDRQVPITPPAAGAPESGPCDLYECKISIETDWQLYQVFGDLMAETAYATTLLVFVSNRYEIQADTILTYPYVQFYTNSNDPWVSQDQGGNCIDLLYEFQAAWVGSIPAGGRLGHFLSGANLGCGVAWLDVLCDNDYNFSVSGNVDGSVGFPVVPNQITNWDFMVAAHELGHNFGALHTHDYCPPLDECAPPGYFGSCQTQQNCTNQGTIMSYCHLCGGGMTNITTWFHPQITPILLVGAMQCLPDHDESPQVFCVAKVSSAGCTPAIGYTGSPTLSPPDNFHVTCDDVINNKNGIVFWGYGAYAMPFQGGYLCVQPQLVRTPVQNSGGNPPPNDCSGSLDFHATQSYLLGKGVTPGTWTAWQAWNRDPDSPSTTGLSDALRVTFCD